MAEQEKNAKIEVVSRILKENGINIKFSGDYCFVSLEYQGEKIIDCQGEDVIIKLGNETLSTA